MTDPLPRQLGFGLVFAPDRPIPGLAPGGAPSPGEVRVHLQRQPRWAHPAAGRAVHPPPGGESALAVTAFADGALLLQYADGTRFALAPGGTEVWAWWAPEATLDDTATYLLGPVAALLLRQRGRVPLHAGAVLLGGGAVALAGPGGAGKSTLAATFAQLGHRVVADDVLALEGRPGGVAAYPAYPRLRLWPDSARALFGHEDALSLLTPGWDKRYLDLGDGFPAEPAPLAAVYLLGARAQGEPSVRPLAPREGLLRLVATTCATFVPDPAMRERELRLLGRVAREVPLRAVTPPDDPRALPALCRAIVADAASARHV